VGLPIQIHRAAINADIPAIRRLLSAGKLPADDCDEHIDGFVVIEEKDEIIGVGGLEICGAVGLVRSISVAREYRGKGIARYIYRLIEGKAHGLGINELYLLTESAVEYFRQLGFAVRQRTDVPESVMSTRQFKEFCPSSAVVMFRDISGEAVRG